VLSVSRQCKLLGLSRSSYYYQPATESAENLALMALIDREYTAHPFRGSRGLRAWLRREGHEVNRKRVQRLMRLMGLEAVYPKRRLSVGAAGRKVYPYLLRGVAIERVNQVWSTDITYIPMPHGFMYLTAVMDWHSRYVLSRRLSNSLDAAFCLQALEEALSRGCPKCSTPTRECSSHRRPSPVGWKRRGPRRAWMGRVAAWTTCSWSGCGGR
jgi:putative transposase